MFLFHVCQYGGTLIHSYEVITGLIIDGVRAPLTDAHGLFAYGNLSFHNDLCGDVMNNCR